MLQTTTLSIAGSEALDVFVRSQPGSLIYTSESYIRLVAEETGSQPHWIVSTDTSGIRAALPVLVKHGRLGPVVNSLAYYGSNGGIVARGDDDEVKVAVLKAFVAFCESIGACASTIITNPLLNDSEVYQRHLPYDLRDERIGQLTFFPDDRDPQTLLSRFDDPRPRNIRKAQRANIRVIIKQSDDALDFLYATHDQNIRSIGGLPKRQAFFRAVARTLPANGWKIYLAEHEAQPIAALLLLYFNRTVEYFTPCVVESYRTSQALSLLIFQAMVDAMTQGYVQWNWGGTWLSQDGVYAFKKKWGTTDTPYYYFTRLHSSSVRSATREELLKEYPGFFVLPFSVLESRGRAGEIA